MRDVSYIERQIEMYIPVVKFARSNKYAHVLISETTDLLNSVCKELILAQDSIPAESFRENLVQLHDLNLDSSLILIMLKYYEGQYRDVDFTSINLLSFLCTVACIFLELRSCLYAYNSPLADMLTKLGIFVCEYMEELI